MKQILIAVLIVFAFSSCKKASAKAAGRFMGTNSCGHSGMTSPVITPDTILVQHVDENTISIGSYELYYQGNDLFEADDFHNGEAQFSNHYSHLEFTTHQGLGGACTFEGDR